LAGLILRDPWQHLNRDCGYDSTEDRHKSVERSSQGEQYGGAAHGRATSKVDRQNQGGGSGQTKQQSGSGPLNGVTAAAKPLGQHVHGPIKNDCTGKDRDIEQQFDQRDLPEQIHIHLPQK
jgi:hypothetical protein